MRAMGFTQRRKGFAKAQRGLRVFAKPLRLCAKLSLVVLLASCAKEPPPPPPAAEPAADWSQFEGGQTPVDPKNVRVVPATPIEVTNVPYIRAVRLAWSASQDVPSYEPQNETLKLPDSARQAVLLVAVSRMPDDADIHVEWFYGAERVFVDALQSREDGEHYFALVKREGRRLEALPKGEYRAEVRTGQTLVKTVRFEVKA